MGTGTTRRHRTNREKLNVYQDQRRGKSTLLGRPRKDTTIRQRTQWEKLNVYQNQRRGNQSLMNEWKVIQPYVSGRNGKNSTFTETNREVNQLGQPGKTRRLPKPTER